MDKIKVAILKGRKGTAGASGVDYFAQNLFQQLQTIPDLEVQMVYGNYKLPGILKFLHFGNLDQFDIIHNCVPALGIFIRTKKPIITTFYDDIMFRPKIFLLGLNFVEKIKTSLVKKLWAWGLIADIQRSTSVVAISHESRRALASLTGISERKITVIPPGIRTDLFKPLPRKISEHNKRNLIIFYCGRICQRKGTDLLLDAMVLLKQELNYRFELRLTGTVDDAFDLEKEIIHRGLVGKVFYLKSPTDRDLAFNHNKADVFVFPSRAEGYGIPPLEAMACGTRVVSTRIPSVKPFPDIVKVEPAASSIAKGILKAASKPWPSLSGSKARLYPYSIDAVAHEYHRLYQKLTKTAYEEASPKYTTMLKNMERRDKKRLFRYFDKILPKINRLMINKSKKIQVLDIGCGVGTVLEYFSSRGYQNLVGVDVNKHSLEIVRQRSPYITVKYGDVYKLPVQSGKFDLVIMTEVVEHLDRPEMAIKELSRVLARGGAVLITTPNRMGLMGLSNGPIGFLKEGYLFKSLLRILGKTTCGPEHPKEYFAFELARLLKKGGFEKFDFPLACYIPFFPMGKYYLLAIRK